MKHPTNEELMELITKLFIISARQTQEIRALQRDRGDPQPMFWTRNPVRPLMFNGVEVPA